MTKRELKKMIRESLSEIRSIPDLAPKGDDINDTINTLKGQLMDAIDSASSEDAHDAVDALMPLVKSALKSMKTYNDGENFRPLGGLTEKQGSTAGITWSSTIHPNKNVPNYLRFGEKKETKEYVIGWYVNGKYDESKTYYTNDKKDFIETQRNMKREVDDKNKTV